MKFIITEFIHLVRVIRYIGFVFLEEMLICIEPMRRNVYVVRIFETVDKNVAKIECVHINFPAVSKYFQISQFLILIIIKVQN